MKKQTYLACLIILVLNISLIAQPEPSIVLDKTYGTLLNEYSRIIRQTPDGGYLIAGDKEINGSTNTNISLLKTDAIGTIIWEKDYGFLKKDRIIWALDNALQIVYKADGTTVDGYVIVGTTTSYSDHGEGGQDVYLIRTYANGDEKWSKTFGGVGNDYARSIRVTSDGGFIITGLTTSFGVVANDVYVIKTDSNGDLEWQATYNLTHYDDSNDVEETATGYLIFGRGSKLFKINSNGDSDPTYGSFSPSAGQGDIDRPINGYNKVFTSGGTGNFLKKIPGGYIGCGSIDSDGFLVRLNDEGEIISNSTITSPGNNPAYVVKPISDVYGDGYIVAGETDGAGAGGWDFWIVRTDLDGNVLWEQTYGGTESEWCTSMQLTSDGGIVMTGLMNSFGAGGTDFWLLKICDPKVLCYLDSDNDGFGDPNFPQQFCEVCAEGYVLVNTDCDDNNPDINPGEEEICDDNIDNNCDDLVDIFSSTTIQTIIDFYDAEVLNGNILPSGGRGQIMAFRNKLIQAQAAGNESQALNKLEWCLERCDDHTFLPNQPPNNNANDFLQGTGVPALYDLIQMVIDNLNCQDGDPLTLAKPIERKFLEAKNNQPSNREYFDFGEISKGGFALYPNPATNILHLELSTFLGQPISISIYNHLGQQVLHLERQGLLDPLFSIDLKNHQLSNGIYSLVVQNKDGQERQIRQFVLMQ